MREACPRNNELVSACSASWLYAKTAANAIVLAARFFAGTEQGSPAKSTLVYEDVIPRFTPCSAVSYSVSISGFGNGEEISTCVILLSGSRLASSSTSCRGSVRVLRNKILVTLPFTLILLRL